MEKKNLNVFTDLSFPGTLNSFRHYIKDKYWYLKGWFGFMEGKFKICQTFNF